MALDPGTATLIALGAELLKEAIIEARIKELAKKAGVSSIALDEARKISRERFYSGEFDTAKLPDV